MKARPILLAGALGLLFAAPARAQMAVYDASSYAKLLQQAKTALEQLNQLKRQVEQADRLAESLNVRSNVNAIASQLSTPELRQFLPDLSKFMAAGTSGDFSSLGALGERAGQIRSAERIYTPGPATDQSAADRYAAEALERSGERIARDMALAESVGAMGAQRLVGLEDLRRSLDTAGDARAVFDIQARIPRRPRSSRTTRCGCRAPPWFSRRRSGLGCSGTVRKPIDQPKNSKQCSAV